MLVRANFISKFKCVHNPYCVDVDEDEVYVSVFVLLLPPDRTMVCYLTLFLGETKKIYDIHKENSFPCLSNHQALL